MRILYDLEKIYTDVKKQIALAYDQKIETLDQNDIEYELSVYLSKNLYRISNKDFSIILKKLLKTFSVQTETEIKNSDQQKEIVHNAKIYTCEYCNRQFGNFGNYNSHVLTHNKQENIIEN